MFVYCKKPATFQATNPVCRNTTPRRLSKIQICTRKDGAAINAIVPTDIGKSSSSRKRSFQFVRVIGQKIMNSEACGATPNKLVSGKETATVKSNSIIPLARHSLARKGAKSWFELSPLRVYRSFVFTACEIRLFEMS